MRLTGSEADAYLAELGRLLRVARPSAHFPSASRLGAYLALLGPAGSQGKLRSLEVDPGSGLPARRTLERLRAMQEVARQYLGRARRRHAAGSGFYASLLAAELPSFPFTEARLMSRGPAGERLLVAHDLREASGCFARFSVELVQRGGGQILLERGDLARPSPRFEETLRACAQGGAEALFLSLSTLEALEVEEVVLGRFGPVERKSEGTVLHLSLERAGRRVAEDRGADPFAPLDLSEAARERRAALGYRVSRERRLFCTPALEEPLRAALREAGARLVVRSC